MKIKLLVIFALLLSGFNVLAQPGWRSFTTNQFSTNGLQLKIKSGALFTNAQLRGVTSVVTQNVGSIFITNNPFLLITNPVFVGTLSGGVGEFEGTVTSDSIVTGSGSFAGNVIAGGVFYGDGSGLSNAFNIVFWGADPTGAMDSTVEIQAAIDYVSTLGGGQVVVPIGNFHITNALIGKSRVIVSGFGSNSVIWQKESRPAFQPENDFALRDLTVAGPYTNGAAVPTNGTVGVLAQHGGSVNISMADTNWTGARLHLRNVVFRDWDQCAVGPGPNSIIEGCQFLHIAHEAILAQGDWTRITGNYFEDMYSWGVDINSSFCVVSGNVFVDCGRTNNPTVGEDGGGVVIAAVIGKASYNVISGNTFSRSDFCGVLITANTTYRCDGNTVTANTFTNVCRSLTDSANGAIAIVNANGHTDYLVKDTTVIGNTIQESGKYGMVFRSTANTRAIGNAISGAASGEILDQAAPATNTTVNIGMAILSTNLQVASIRILDPAATLKIESSVGSGNVPNKILFSDDNNGSGMAMWTVRQDPYKMFFGYGNFTPSLTVGGTLKSGINTTAPDKAFEINSETGANLRLTYNDSNGTAANYTDFSVSSGGDLTINPSGGDILVSGTITATNGFLGASNVVFHVPTNTPTLNQVVTASSTTGISRWADAAGGGGGATTALGQLAVGEITTEFNTNSFNTTNEAANFKTNILVNLSAPYDGLYQVGLWYAWTGDGVGGVDSDSSVTLLWTSEHGKAERYHVDARSFQGTITNWNSLQTGDPKVYEISAKEGTTIVVSNYTENSLDVGSGDDESTNYVSAVVYGLTTVGGGTNGGNFSTNAVNGNALFTGNVTITGSLSGRTNIAQFDSDNTDVVIGTAYTNSNRRLAIMGSFQLTAAAAGTAKVTIYSILGTTTNKLTIAAGPLAALVTIEPLVMRVQPGGYYYYVDESSGAGQSVSFVTGTHSRFWE